MKLFFDSGNPTRTPPIIRTKVLNAAECGISIVATTAFGHLCCKSNFFGVPRKDIIKVIFLRSSIQRDMPPECKVVADFDVYLSDGRVIEVWSCDRRVITAATYLAPVRDIRDQFRRQRGVL